MTGIPDWVDPRMHKFYHRSYDSQPLYFRPAEHYWVGHKLPYVGYVDELRPTSLIKTQGEILCKYCAREPFKEGRLHFCLCTSAVNEMEIVKEIECIELEARQKVYQLKQRIETECPQDRQRLKEYAMKSIERQFRNPDQVIERLEIR
jgi:hypothetical protein